jgi:NADH:ubiquinone oxidoreductase subunit 6 (subunit J)
MSVEAKLLILTLILIFIGNVAIFCSAVQSRFDLNFLLDEIRSNIPHWGVAIILCILVGGLPMILLTALIHFLFHYKPFKRK